MDRPELTDEAKRLWATAQALNRAAAAVSPKASPLPPLLFFTDPDRTPRPWEAAARLPASAGVVFRHFGRPEALETAQRLRQVTKANGVRLLIGLDADLAETVGADGLHLPGRALDQAQALRTRQPGWLITGAIHGAPTGLAIDLLDAAVLSPIFPAGGASAAKPVLGLERLSVLARAAATPIYALGGIDADTAAQLIGSGACGLAGVAAIQTAFAG